MRITGGENRGRPLFCPEGNDTRPTSDRARAALFNVLNHASFALSFEGAFVLDLFAGTGALGLEALSHGAVSAVFVEKSAKALACLDRNIRSLGHEKAAQIINSDVLKWIDKGSDNQFDFIFLDPPYHKGLGEQVLDRLIKAQCLHNETVVIYEMGVDEGIINTSKWYVCNKKTYGAAHIQFLKPLTA
jgi:16S rRNA (guanine966-N2)-methyltransferase